ncbi:MAG: hypothetical protein ACOCVR_01345, partial [Myxococcota bacterium]
MRITCTVLAIFFVLAGCGEGSLVPVDTHEAGTDPGIDEPTTDELTTDDPESPAETTYLLEIT